MDYQAAFRLLMLHARTAPTPACRNIALRCAGTNHEDGPLVKARVKVRRPVWAKGKGYGQRFETH